MTDDAIISEILNLYGSMAEWFTYTGPTTITSSGDFGTLVPGTDYYVLAFGYADGAAATELTKHKFTTDPEGDPTANTFAFDISGVTARSASIQVEPSDKSVRYIWDIVTDAEYKKYGSNAEGIRSYLADYIKGQIDDFFTTPEEVVSVIGVRGDQWFDYEQLKPATTYYVGGLRRRRRQCHGRTGSKPRFHHRSRRRIDCYRHRRIREILQRQRTLRNRRRDL